MSAEQPETFKFETEAKQILELMTHSVYSKRDVFLRELISNASDALDKRHFEGLQDEALLSDQGEAHIFLIPDQQARTLTIIDNGIGMTRDEVIENIGTIARSGTKAFLTALKDAQASSQAGSAPELIGQFGVGFYAAFMVADRVTLETRKAGQTGPATRWESTGDGSYTIENCAKADVGTRIVLHLKPSDADDQMRDFSDTWVLKDIVKTYSDFVSYPVRMNVERTQPELDDEGKPIEGKTKTVTELETLNSMKALWTKPKSEVTDAEYNDFYKHLSHDWNDPMKTIVTKAEGQAEYRGLLYIPGKAPFDLFHRDSRRGLHLYVRRVFIMDECKDLLPEYLRFVRGVVDSESLSLNVSRELLQQNRQISAIRKHLVKKLLDGIKSIKKTDAAQYATLWGEFGKVLKEGIYLEPEQSETLLDLMRCHTTAQLPKTPAGAEAAAEASKADSEGAEADAETKATDDEAATESVTFLADYVERMKEGQEAIYYMTGPSREAVENSPHLETFVDKGYEVLIFCDPVDEVWLQQAPKYKDKTFQSIGKGEVELGSEEDKQKAKESLASAQESMKTLLDALRTTLQDEVKEVRLSTRMTSSAACLVGDAHDLSPQLQEMMKAMGQTMPPSKRILEVNPTHPVLEKLKVRFDENKDAPIIADYAKLLYGQAVLAEGGQLPDPGAFSKLVAQLMAQAL